MRLHQYVSRLQVWTQASDEALLMSLVSLGLLENARSRCTARLPGGGYSRVVTDLLELAHVPLLSSLADEADPVYARLLAVALAVLHE